MWTGAGVSKNEWIAKRKDGLRRAINTYEAKEDASHLGRTITKSIHQNSICCM